VFEPLYTADEMREAEDGHDVEELMRRAGAAVAEEVLRRFPGARSFAAVCGGGANGGDGRIAAELLRAAGWEERALGEADVVIDALFGTGFHGAPRDDAARAIAQINDARAPVVSVDLPSGVNASTGEIDGAVVDATVTVTMHGPKVGLAVAPGRFHAGDVVVADIGIPARDTEHRLVDDAILHLVPRKRDNDTKYTSGSVLVVGGSPGMTGAVCLTAEAAFRADAGYVAIATHAAAMAVVEARVLEAVKAPLDRVDDLAERASAVAIGPGLGRGEEERTLVRRLLRDLSVPMVVDADALFELEPADWPGPRVLTPHSGELARLLDRDDVDAHRLDAVRDAADRFGCVVLLKGADTLVAAPGEGVLVCTTGTPALATAGSGDVLTGIVAAFLAKGIDARLAAAAAAYAHGRAAELGPERGLIASDLVEALPDVLS
jgi:hydroxyethylthiazole kinase-like uncharacterized protein yjeF